MMTNTAWTTSWNSYMHHLNIQACRRDTSRSHPKVVAMDWFTAHQLRHTYATMLYDAGVDVKTAQDFLSKKLYYFLFMLSIISEISLKLVNVHMCTINQFIIPFSDRFHKVIYGTARSIYQRPVDAVFSFSATRNK